MIKSSLCFCCCCLDCKKFEKDKLMGDSTSDSLVLGELGSGGGDDADADELVVVVVVVLIILKVDKSQYYKLH